MGILEKTKCDRLTDYEQMAEALQSAVTPMRYLTFINFLGAWWLRHHILSLTRYAIRIYKQPHELFRKGQQQNMTKIYTTQCLGLILINLYLLV